MTTETIIYKYPKLKLIFESLCKNHPIKFENSEKWMYTYRVIAPYLNPHTNITKNYYLGYKYSDYLYYVSMHPSNHAVSLLIKNPDKINLDGLIKNTNPNIGPLLEHSLELFTENHWRWMSSFSSNPTIIDFLEKHLDKVLLCYLSNNTCNDAIKILEKKMDDISIWCYSNLSANPSAINIIKNNIINIWWPSICQNAHPEAISILEKNVDKIDFYELSSNYNAIHILEQNLDKIDMFRLSTNPNAMNILMKHPELIDDVGILANPNALSYLESHVKDNKTNSLDYMATYNPKAFEFIEKMLEQGIISNVDIPDIHKKLILNDSFESLFDLDYQAMSKVRIKLIQEELMAKAFHPSRVSKWLDYHCENGGEVADFEM